MRSVCLITGNPTIHMSRWLDAMPLGVPVTMVSTGADPMPVGSASGRITHVHLPLKGVSVRQRLRSLGQVLRLVRAHEIVSLHYISPFMAGLGTLVRRRLVLSFWGTDGIVTYPASSGVARLAYQRSLAHAEVITCNSEPLRRSLAEFEDQIRMVYWPVELDRFRRLDGGRRDQVRANYGVSDHSLMLLSTRQVKPMYRTLELINACRGLLRSGAVSLVLHFSEGTEDPAYLELCRRAARGLPVVFHGNHLSSGELAALLGSADFYLSFASTDSLPSSVLEAMSAGCIALCAEDVYGYQAMRQVLPVELVSLDDGLDLALLQRLLPSRSERETRAREMISRTYSEQAFAANLEAIYRIGTAFEDPERLRG